MKKRIFVFLAIVVMIGCAMETGCHPPVVRAASSTIPTIDYAVVIDGEYTFWPETWFAKWVLQNVFNVPRQNIVFLLANGGIYPDYVRADSDGYATLDNVRDKVRQLAARASNCFLFVSAHGGGFDAATNTLVGGRLEQNGDEGNEVIINGVWQGVDESIALQNGAQESWSYWDDDLRQDLASTNDFSLTIMLNTCFSGGFIDDLSSIYRRTIVTMANETGQGQSTGLEGASYFVYYYLNAFSDYPIKQNFQSYYRDTQAPPINWPYKSWRGAFEYAMKNDVNYLSRKEYPWFDDDGNSLPTYRNGANTLDFPVNDFPESVSSQLNRWLQHDINYDGKVDMKDVAIVSRAYGSTPGLPLWNRTADVFPFEDWKVDVKDISAVAKDFGKTVP